MTVSIASVFVDDEVAVGCDATDYTLANAASTVGAEIPVGDDQGDWGDTDTPTIKFNNKVTNQDACKGAVVNLAYTIS